MENNFYRKLIDSENKKVPVCYKPRYIKWVCIISGILLSIASFSLRVNLPYTYFEILRYIILFSSISIVLYFLNTKENWWAFAIGVIGLLFNPVTPIYISKQNWVGVDIISAITFFMSAYLVNQDLTPTQTRPNKVKMFLNEFLRKKANITVLLVFLSLALLLIYSHSSFFWLIVIAVILLLGIVLEIAFNIPFVRSVLIQLGIFVLLVMALILYAAIRDTYFSKPSYKGDYSPDGTFCDYGYKRATKQCCKEDDYSCEACDLHGTYCDYKDVYQGNVN